MNPFRSKEDIETDKMQQKKRKEFLEKYEKYKIIAKKATVLKEKELYKEAFLLQNEIKRKWYHAILPLNEQEFFFKFSKKIGDNMEEARKEQTRIRVNFKISAKGEFQPDVTSEAETVETAMKNLEKAHQELRLFAQRNYGK